MLLIYVFLDKNRCVTISGADPNKTCIFPFKFDGIKYSTCIRIEGFNNDPFCSTMVDDAGIHISGQGKWGNCGQNCPMP